MTYQRLTLVGTRHPERITVDFDLGFSHANGAVITAPDNTLIVEVKSPDGRGRADQVIRSFGSRPQNCRKYCIGLNLVRDGLKYNVFNQTLKQHFDWAGPKLSLRSSDETEGNGAKVLDA